MRLAALAVGVALTAACGGSANGAAGSPDSPDAPVSATASHDDYAKPRPSLREPEEGLVDIYARRFDKHKARGNKVTLFYYSGVDECYGLDRIEVKERRKKVVLTIYEGRHPEAEVCPEIAEFVRSIATLERPLGDRRVVDGAR